MALTHKAQSEGYRAELDGLRGLAIVLAVGYHAFPQQLSGGFIGVDLFFVLSGFLITQMLLKDLDQGTFGLRKFYERRVRRLFPALTVVLLASLGLGWAVLFADEYLELGAHVIAAAGMLSNFMQWRVAGYFDPAAELKPLFHTWSLGVEEQFYLVWPLILCGIWRLRLVKSPAVLGLGLLGFLGGLLTQRVDPIGAYYSPFSRAWELLAGAQLACLAGTSWSVPKAFREAIGIIGISIILISAIVLTPLSLYPWRALYPVVGTLLLMLAGAETSVHRFIFTRKVMVGLGQISYPLYLWHYPLLVLLAVMDIPGAWIRAGASLLAVFLAWVTFRFIEAPIRFRRRLSPLQLVAGLAVPAMLGVLVVGAEGFSFRTKDHGALVAFGRYRRPFKRCEGNPGVCYENHPEKKPSVLVIGDSQAASFVYGLYMEGARADFPALFTVRMGCFPLWGVETVNEHRRPMGCRQVFTSAVDWVAHEPEIKKVIIVGKFVSRLLPTDNNFPEFESNDADHASKLTSIQAFDAGLRRTFKILTAAHKEVVFLHEPPSLTVNPRNCLGRAFRSPPGTCVQPLDRVRAGQEEIRTIVSNAAREFPSVREFDPLPVLCEGSTCSPVLGGKLLYTDRSHLSPYGAKRVWESMVAKLGLERAPATASEATRR